MQPVNRRIIIIRQSLAHGTPRQMLLLLRDRRRDNGMRFFVVFVLELRQAV
jgi:hypothetical protein